MTIAAVRVAADRNVTAAGRTAAANTSIAGPRSDSEVKTKWKGLVPRFPSRSDYFDQYAARGNSFLKSRVRKEPFDDASPVSQPDLSSCSAVCVLWIR